MNQQVGYKEVFGYFRMGLVTGLVDKQELIAWADRQIIEKETAESEIIELSLCGKRPYSEIIWLLGQFEHGSDYQTSVNLILARAGLLAEQNSRKASDIIMGLRLLIEEEWLAKTVKAQLQTQKHNLEQYKSQAITYDSLAGQLRQFLAPYRQYRPHLTTLLQVNT
jgi:hypothetical protein